MVRRFERVGPPSVLEFSPLHYTSTNPLEINVAQPCNSLF